jgi:nucleoporin POM152
MNGTPRLRSAFPSTPQTLNGQRRFGSPASSPGSKGIGAQKLPPVASLQKKAPPEPPSQPLIPEDTIDAATQRLFVVSCYACLWAYRLYDFYGLITNSSSESLWLFMKWVGIDGAVLFGLPALRIPWLEWSAPVVTMLFLIHVLANGMLMFKVGLPITIWLEILAKSLYDRELSISEHKVKPADLFDSSSLISGKHVINILPEG